MVLVSGDYFPYLVMEYIISGNEQARQVSGKVLSLSLSVRLSSFDDGWGESYILFVLDLGFEMGMDGMGWDRCYIPLRFLIACEMVSFDLVDL